MEEVGALIKRLREEKGMSQRQLATLSRVDRGYINQLEAGKEGSISLRTARKLAIALGKPPEVFLQNGNSSHTETPEEILDRLKLATPVSIPIYTDYPFHAGDPVEPIDFVYRARPKLANKNIEGYVVHGKCLEPHINNGDVIIVDRDGEINNGDIVACLLDNELHLARLRKIADELWLENKNSRRKFEECQMAAPVIECIRRLK